jgi:hypothetical protein
MVWREIKKIDHDGGIVKAEAYTCPLFTST